MNYLQLILDHWVETVIILAVLFYGIEMCIRAARGKKS